MVNAAARAADIVELDDVIAASRDEILRLFLAARPLEIHPHSRREGIRNRYWWTLLRPCFLGGNIERGQQADDKDGEA